MLLDINSSRNDTTHHNNSITTSTTTIVGDEIDEAECGWWGSPVQGSHGSIYGIPADARSRLAKMSPFNHRI